MSTVAGYGTWRSPITAEAITVGQVGLAEPRLDGGSAYWLEARPQEAGRTVLVRRTPAGERQDLTPRRSTCARACTSTAAARTRCGTASSSPPTSPISASIGSTRHGAAR